MADPIAYVRGAVMTGAVTFDLSPAPANPVSGARVEGVIEGLGKFTANGVTIPASSTGQANVTADTVLPGETKLYDKMSIAWRVGTDGNPCVSQCAEVGTSANQAYVTLATPVAAPGGTAGSPLLLTALHLAIASGGAADEATAIQKTWAKFAGPANVKTWDGRSLYYYPPMFGFSSCAATAAALLSTQEGRGQCNSFATLLMAALAANGISSSDNKVTPADSSSTAMVIKNWNWGTPTSTAGDPNYPYKLLLYSGDGGAGMYSPGSSSNQYGDLVSLSTLPGQNTTPPNEKVFGSHFIVSLSPAVGPFYDPSYGVTYDDPADFERKAVAGYAVAVGTVLNSSPTLLELKAKQLQPGAVMNIAIAPFLF